MEANEKSALNEAKQAENFSPLRRQILASSGPLLLPVTLGMTYGYSAIMLPQLEDEDSAIQVTKEQSSWIASMTVLPMILGCVLSGILLETFGRKSTQIATAIPLVIGWIVIGAADSFEVILVGRFITGFSVGLPGGCASISIAETSDPKYRGFFLTGISMAMCVGIFLSHLLGTFLRWQTVAFASTIMPLLSIWLLILIPDTPTWLANRGNTKAASEAFFWFRGKSPETIKELNVLLLTQTVEVKGKSTWSDCTEPEFWKPLLVVITFMLTTQFSGVKAISFYSISILQDTVGKDVNEYVAMLGIDAIQIMASILACMLTNTCKRRPLTIASCMGTAISLTVLSAFLYLAHSYRAINHYPYIPLAALISFIVFDFLGLMPLSWALAGEVFPQRLRGMGSGISTCLNFAALFTVVKTYPALSARLGPPGVFLVYACATLVGGVILYVFLPETKGKTLQQIEEHYKSVPTR